jgi:hypothetical protein
MISMLALLLTVFLSPLPQQSAPMAGIVNGDTIALDVYAREVGRRSELNALGGTASPSDVMQETWEAMVRRELLRQEAQRLGVEVSTRQIDSVLLKATPDFVRRGIVDEKGRFDSRLLQAMLYRPDSLARARLPKASAEQVRKSAESISASMDELRMRVADVMRQERLRAATTDLATLDTAALRREYGESLHRATADLIYLPCQPAPLTPTDAEIEAWYWADSTRYTTSTEMRQLGLFIWPLTASPADSSLILANVRAFVAMVNGEHDAVQRDSIWTSVAETVQSVAVVLSPDSAEQADFYTLVKSTRGGKPGTCIGPVFHPLGIHVILVDSVLRGTKPSYAVRVLLSPVEPSKPTADSILAEVRTAAQMFRDGRSVADISQTFQKPLTASPWVAPGGKLYDSYRLVQAAFEFPVGSIPDPIDTPESGVMLGVIVDSIAPGPMPVEAARERIVQDMVRDHACRHLERRAKTMFGMTTRLSDGRMFVGEQLPGTTIWRDQTLDGSGFVGPEVYDPLASLAIRRSQPGSLIGPFRGETGWWVANVQSSYMAETESFESWLRTDGALYVQRQREAAWEAWQKDLRKRAQVTDLRWVYFRY